MRGFAFVTLVVKMVGCVSAHRKLFMIKSVSNSDDVLDHLQFSPGPQAHLFSIFRTRESTHVYLLLLDLVPILIIVGKFEKFLIYFQRIGI